MQTNNAILGYKSRHPPKSLNKTAVLAGVEEGVLG